MGSAAAMRSFDSSKPGEINARVRPTELEHYRAVLTKYARRWLRNVADAEDAVQDTLTAALASTGFSGRSSASTWLHGILKHKIVDTYRRQAREPVCDIPPDDELQDDGQGHVLSSRCFASATCITARTSG